MKLAATASLLRTLVGDAALLQGYYSENDGGEGIFSWSDKPAVDDGGLVFNADGLGSLGAGWRRAFTGPLSVRWFGAKGLSTDDTLAIKAAYAAAATRRSATVYFPAGSYAIASTITIGDLPNGTFTSINTIGEGAVSTTLAWVGPSTDVTVRYWRNKYARMSGIAIVNSTVRGTTIGLSLTGPASGTQSNNLVFENCKWQGFDIGLSAGGGIIGTEAASEIAFINCGFALCNSGYSGTGTGNTLNVWFYGCSFQGNLKYGASLGTSGATSFWGGGSNSNGIAAISPNGDWQGTLLVLGFRFELTPPEIAIGSSLAVLSVDNCLFFSTGAVPSYPVIGASYSAASIRNCRFGQGADTGWIPYDAGIVGAACSLEMTGNVIKGTLPFYISPSNSGSNGLVYSMFGNILAGTRHGLEQGRVVWPNRVENTIRGKATFVSAGSVNVSFTTRENSAYSVEISGSEDETFWCTNRTTTGFVLHSSNLSSIAAVDWTVSR